MPFIVSKNRTCQILQTGHVKIPPPISIPDMFITFVRVRPVFVRVRVIFSFKIKVLRTS